MKVAQPIKDVGRGSMHSLLKQGSSALAQEPIGNQPSSATHARAREVDSSTSTGGGSQELGLMEAPAS